MTTLKGILGRDAAPEGASIRREKAAGTHGRTRAKGEIHAI